VPSGEESLGSRGRQGEAIDAAADLCSEAVPGEIVRRVVEVAQPRKVVLFCSAAREAAARPDSDLDLLVIKEGVHRRRLAAWIYESLVGAGRAVDVVVVTPEDVERFGESPTLVIGSALREGRVVYNASPDSSSAAPTTPKSGSRPEQPPPGPHRPPGARDPPGRPLLSGPTSRREGSQGPPDLS
jgi:predicted nucleotidyltransferase